MTKDKAYWNQNNGPGRPKKEVTEKVNEVYKLLPKDGSLIPSQKLKDKAKEEGMGYDTLYKYLKKLNRAGYVTREYGEEDSYPPKVYYRRTEPLEIFGPISTDLRVMEGALAFYHRQLATAEEAEKKELEKKIEEELEKSFKRELMALPFVFAGGIEKIKEMDLGEFGNGVEYAKRCEEFAEVFVKINLLPLLFHLSTTAKVAGVDLAPDDLPFADEVREYFSSKNLNRLVEFRREIEKDLLPEDLPEELQDAPEKLRDFYLRKDEAGGEKE